MTSGIRIQAWGRTDKGRVREVNQDSFLLDRRLGLFVVADGMGGGEHGEIASKLACNVVREKVLLFEEKLLEQAETPDPKLADEIQELLVAAVKRANREVFEASEAFGVGRGRMGSTLEATLIVGDVAFLCHVGDSRTWLLREGAEEQLTKDHSLVQERIDKGLITPEEAETSPQRSVITRAIGVSGSVAVDTARQELQVGDSLLLSSDGLFRYMKENELAKWVGATSGTATVDTLVTLANNRGGRDNITVILITANQPSDQKKPEMERRHLDVLRQCGLFSTCTGEELRQVGAACRVRDLPPGSTIFSEGDPGLECYVIAEGEVTISRQGTPLADLTVGDHFGEMSLLDAPNRGATAISKGPVKLLVITRREFEDLMRQNALLATRVLWHLSAHLSKMVRATTRLILK